MKRDYILLSTLYLVDEDIVPMEMVDYLDKNVNKEEAITPDKLISVCFMFWATSPKLAPTSEHVQAVRNNLVHCLSLAWQHKESWLKRVSVLQKNKLKGWRISESHRHRKIAQAFNVPVK